MSRSILVRATALALCAFAAAGCAALGVAANAMPRPPVKPKVVLAGTSVGVMVWADRGLRAAWPNVQENLGSGVQQRILIAQGVKQKELEGATFPYPAASFVAWQRNHPEMEAEPITDVAPRLHVRRLIYVELETLDTRASNAMALYRGNAEASLKVLDCDDPTKPAKILYEERIRVTDSKQSTDDGRPDSSDSKMYVATMSRLADEIAKRFVEHPAEDD